MHYFAENAPLDRGKDGEILTVLVFERAFCNYQMRCKEKLYQKERIPIYNMAEIAVCLVQYAIWFFSISVYHVTGHRF